MVFSEEAKARIKRQVRGARTAFTSACSRRRLRLLPPGVRCSKLYDSACVHQHQCLLCMAALHCAGAHTQVEFYFSDSNLPRDVFLCSKVDADPEVRARAAPRRLERSTAAPADSRRRPRGRALSTSRSSAPSRGWRMRSTCASGARSPSPRWWPRCAERWCAGRPRLSASGEPGR